MDTVIFGSGDKIEYETDEFNDGEKKIKDNNYNIFRPIEDFGDRNSKKDSIDNNINKLNEDNVVFHVKEHCDEYRSDNNILNNNTDSAETNTLNNSYSSETSDVSMPDITDRIKECKNIIASLKLELNDEKLKLEQEYQHGKPEPEVIVPCKESNSANYLADLSYPTNFFTASLDTKLCSDRNLFEYEKQLQKYQRTLNMAQNAKKNAIRKQMLAKAFKLKLLEVENQCNIELLRIKQNLQCLEPLKMISETWKHQKDNRDLTKYDLIPLFPEIYASNGSDSISADRSDIEQTNH